MKKQSVRWIWMTAAATWLLGGLAANSPAATLNVIVAGYYGGNFLSDQTTLLPDGTAVDFGVFYSAGAFTSAGVVSSNLASASTSLPALSNFRAANGWVSFGSITVNSGTGDFSLLWDAIDSSAAPGLGVEFNLDPTTGALAGKSLVGVTPYVWVQTSGGTPEFWVGRSNASLPAAGFGALYQGDVTDTGDPATGFTMLVGKSISSSGIATIPEPSTVSLSVLGLALLALRRSKSSNI